MQNTQNLPDLSSDFCFVSRNPVNLRPLSPESAALSARLTAAWEMRQEGVYVDPSLLIPLSRLRDDNLPEFDQIRAKFAAAGGDRELLGRRARLMAHVCRPGLVALFAEIERRGLIAIAPSEAGALAGASSNEMVGFIHAVQLIERGMGESDVRLRLMDLKDQAPEGAAEAVEDDFFSPGATPPDAPLFTAGLRSRMTRFGVLYRPLGVRNGVYYFQSSDCREIIASSADALKSVAMRLNSSYAFWEENYSEDEKKRINWDKARMDLIADCHRVGLVDVEEKILGAGVWRIGTGADRQTVINVGDAAYRVAGDEMTEIEDIYDPALPFIVNPQPRRTQGVISAVSPLTTVEGAEFVRRLSTSPRWAEPLGGRFFAGWLASASICGALRWRSHAHVTGPSGSGKTTLVDKVARPIIEGVGGLIEAGGVTEPALRRQAKRDAPPILIDEAEADTHQDQQRLTAILQAARVASSGGRTTKAQSGGGHGYVSYVTRYQLLFSSIAPIADGQANESRITEMRLTALPKDIPDAARAAWGEFLDYCLTTITPEFGLRMMRRMASRVDLLEKTEDLLRVAITRAGGTARYGDQAVTLLASAHVLGSDALPTEAEIEALITQGLAHDIKSKCSGNADLETALAIILQHTDSVMGDNVRLPLSIAEMISVVAGITPHQHEALLPDHLHTYLKRAGLMVKDQHLYIAQESQYLQRIFHATASQRWGGRRWIEILRQHSHATQIDKTRFGSTTSRGIRLPLAVVLPSED